jgi:osmotically-inducible protein OsmY
MPARTMTLKARAADAVVTLRGYLRDDHERHMAQANAWYVFAVDDVVNEIEVREPGRSRMDAGSRSPGTSRGPGA